MRAILLDTNAYAAFKRGSPEAVEIIRHAPVLALSVISLGELLCGFVVGTREASNRQELRLFLSSSRVKLFSVDEITAERYATIYRELRMKGRPIPSNDLWIAAIALQHDLAIFSYDDHFRSIEGIQVGSSLFELVR